MIRYFPALFVVLWSTGFIGARMGMPYAEPASFLSLRYGIAIVLLGGMALMARKSSTKSIWPDWRLACHSMVVGVFLHGIYLGGVFWVIDHGFPAGISAMIIGLQPLVVALFAGSVLGEKVSVRNWQGLIIGLVGLGLVILPKIEFGTSGITPLTVSITVMAMFASTIGTIYQKKFASHVDVRTGTLWQYVGAIIPSAIYVLLFEEFAFQWNGELIFALAWAVLVLSIGAVFMLLKLIREGSVAKVSALFYLVPASTAIIAYFLFGETLNLLQLFGMMLCAIGVKFAYSKSTSKSA